MMTVQRHAAWAILLGSLLSTALEAQDLDGYTLPGGTLRLSVGAQYSSFDRTFGEGGLGEFLRVPLLPATFSPLTPLQASLSAFLASTQGAAGATPFVLASDAVSLGEPDVAVAVSRERVPFSLDIGVFRRLQVGVSVPLVRGRQLIQGVALVSPNVGANPDPERNAELLGRVGPGGTALGASALLPTAESAAGVELQRRVGAATGGAALVLPRGDSVAATVLQRLLQTGLGDSLRNSSSAWRPGDVEIHGRLSLLDHLGGAPVPEAGQERALRAVLVGGIRLPTGAQPDTVGLFPRDPDVGLAGFQVGVIADLFWGRRWWVTGSVRQVTLGSAQVKRRIAPSGAPLSTSADQEVDWNPGDTLEVAIAPRYRIAEGISLGAEYAAGWIGESAYDGGPTDAVQLRAGGGGLSHRVGLGARFTSLPAFAAGETRVPIEIQLTYRRALGGPAGLAAESGLQLQGSLFPSLW